MNDSRQPQDKDSQDSMKDEGMAADSLFTTYGLAEYLKVSARTVQREVERGKLSFVMVGGRRRYRREDVERYLRTRLQRSRFRVIQGGRHSASG